jgi:5-methylcytosine-specific restriction endonuclease McrA
MRDDKPDYVGLYGNVLITKSWCESCNCYAFVIGGKLQCCDSKRSAIPQLLKRETMPEQIRKRPSLPMRKHIMELQNYSCFYCLREFGTKIVFKSKVVTLRLHWDHVAPWSYLQNNQTENFVASCHLCNLWKSSTVFQTIDEAQIFLILKWKEELAGSPEPIKFGSFSKRKTVHRVNT